MRGGLALLSGISLLTTQDLTQEGWKFGDVPLAVVDSIKERCLQWIGRERKLILTLILTLMLILNTNPKLILKMIIQSVQACGNTDTDGYNLQ